MQVKIGHFLLLERFFFFFTTSSITFSRTSHGLIPTQAVSFPFCSWHVTKHCNYAYLYIPLSLSSIEHTCPHSNFLPLILILRCTNHISSLLASRTLSVALCVGNEIGQRPTPPRRTGCIAVNGSLSLVAPHYSTPDTPSGKFNIPFAGRLLQASEPLWRFYRVRTHPLTPDEASRGLY